MEYLIKNVAQILNENGISPTDARILNVLRRHQASVGTDQDEIYAIVNKLYKHQKKDRIPVFLSIDRCPIHRNFWSISVEYPDGTGRRLTPSKCCGQWEIQWKFRIDNRLTEEILNEFTK